MTCAAECGRERDHRNEDQLALISSSLNAAPEWQAESLGWRSRGLLEAYSIEGLVRWHHSTIGKPFNLNLLTFGFTRC
jgi:hypothetical protein